jgi:hypothetical protein
MSSHPRVSEFDLIVDHMFDDFPVSADAAPAGPGVDASRKARLPISACSLLVVGVVRNGERRMRGDLDTLRRAVTEAGFTQVQWLIVESDSTDGTLDVLGTLQAQWTGFAFISLGVTRQAHPLRTDRIAHARNAYLAALDDDPRYVDVTHVMVADLDGVCGAVSARALVATWQLDEPWSVCSANQGDYYYDVWALRHRLWCPDDAWTLRNALLPVLGEIEADRVALFSRMVHIPPRRAPIEVDSAFGGLAIYRRDALQGARYDGLDAHGREVCEHVALNAGLRARGHRLYIHPALINARRTKHAGRKKFFRTLRRSVWNLLRGKPWR